MSHNIPPEPWHSFLTDVDALVSVEVYLHCLGGFVMQQLYGLPRPTVDIDTLPISPREQTALLIDKAGKGSELCLKHKVYLDIVGVCDYPESYNERLTEMFPGAYKNLRLFALEVHDLALAKLGRNSSRDREDIRFLAKKAPLEINILKETLRKRTPPLFGQSSSRRLNDEFVDRNDRRGPSKIDFLTYLFPSNLC